MESGYYISNNRRYILDPNLEKLNLVIDQSNNLTTVICNGNLKKLCLDNRDLDAFRKIVIDII
jgi:hypothetical protein